ncbi:MAG TPA: HprK-related kinase A [Rhodocyclaceae bacterium]|nr:HprK-related kinase A [Rhodocyclaceae bacterium]
MNPESVKSSPLNIKAPATLADLSSSELRARLKRGELVLRSGPIRTAIRCARDDVAATLWSLYGDYPIEVPGGFADFHVHLRGTDLLRRWIKPQIIFEHDGHAPFLSLPQPQAFALLEWGMNWCIANYCHQYLMVHAAVVEKDGFAAILPAPPGSGKSTLCAGLVHRGWRLLSDEITLIDPATCNILGLARPINLKNASIGIMRAYVPGAVFGPVVPDTKKGTVAHLRAPSESVKRVDEPARPRWIVFPKYEAGSAPVLTPMPKHSAFLQLAENAFNYAALGRQGFEVLGEVIDMSDCLSFRYSRLDDAIAIFDDLAARARDSADIAEEADVA